MHGREPRDVTAGLVTHEHSDHVQGVERFVRRYNSRVLMTPGTASAAGATLRVETLSCHRPLTIDAIRVEPFPVPHDAREPCQFVFVAGERRPGPLTDSGHVTPPMLDPLGSCDALALECNHDLETLRAGPYPESLKARVASRFGHLNNAQACDLLGRLEQSRLQWVAGLHLSERNNSPDHVRTALGAVLERARYPLHLAEQDDSLMWLAVD